MYKIVEYTHKLINDYFNQLNNKEIICCDATCGNGNDTLFIANLLQDNGYVDAYDIQEIAINNTKKLLDDNNINNVNLYRESHENINPSKYNLILFNLGYLPKGDKNIHTTAFITIPIVTKILKTMETKKDLMLIIAVYPGHEEGKIESDKLLNLVSDLDSSIYYVATYNIINQHNCPYVISINHK